MVITMSSYASLARALKKVCCEDRVYPLHEPEFLGRELIYAQECIETGWVSSAGKFVDQLEIDAANYLGVKHCIAVSAGTTGLHLMMVASGVQPGEEVFCPSMTFVATANAITHAGAIPHFVDIDLKNLCLCPDKLEEHIEKATIWDGQNLFNRETKRRIRAVITVNAFGHSADVQKLRRLCDRYNLNFFEDAACAIGSTSNQLSPGAVSDAAVFSFNGNKIITSGGGGLIATNSADLAKIAKHLSTTAKKPDQWEYVHDRVGFNYRMPNLNAALAVAQLEELDNKIIRKRALFKVYAEALRDLPHSLVEESEGCYSNYWLVCLKLDCEDILERNEYLQALADVKLVGRPIWKPMHQLPMYSACPRGDLDSTELIHQCTINLPSSPNIVRT